jgi:hypothetical protein
MARKDTTGEGQVESEDVQVTKGGMPVIEQEEERKGAMSGHVAEATWKRRGGRQSVGQVENRGDEQSGKDPEGLSIRCTKEGKLGGAVGERYLTRRDQESDWY